VATLPEGEDPDTLVQRQGGAALEQTVKDAVDVFERKIQILERRGFFGTLPGRRRALDRLLPAIRAAGDPITRELYLSRAAEVASVRRDVLEREIAIGGGGIGDAGSVPTHPPSASPSPALPTSAEKALLLLLLEGEPWRAKSLEAVGAAQCRF